MKMLLDTHAVIWALTDDRRLKGKVKENILNPEHSVYFSIVSLWEIAIKNAKSPEKCPYNEKEVCHCCLESGFEMLDLAPEHIFSLRQLKVKENSILANMDPFDRILLAQAKTEGMRLVSADSNFKNYDEKCILKI